MDRRILYGLILIGMLIYGWTLLREGGPLLGKPAPSFSLPNGSGVPVSLGDYQGRVVLLHFWATWCPPCVQEIPKFRTLMDRFSSDDFVVLGIAMEEDWPTIRAFNQKIPIPFEVLLDQKGDVALAYGTNRLPESYLIDRHGRVVKKIVGPQDWSAPQWQDVIKPLLAR